MPSERFRTIGVLGRVEKKAVVESVHVLIPFLRQRKARIILESDVAAVMQCNDCEVMPREEIGAHCDLIIVVGGDGSLLAAARILSKFDVPVLGINRGRLGFLTDVKPEEIEQQVGEVLNGKYLSDSRFMLEVEVERDGKVVASADALNDVVFKSGRSARMIEFELWIDGKFVYNQHSDGLIVSTPTGSTAYAMSGGGPIMYPNLDAMVLVPMFPHTLSSRPLVIDNRSELRLVVLDCHPQISCDGQVHMNLHPGDEIYINKKPHRLKLIHPMDHDFYATCRDKLGWGGRLAEE
ncbi:MAG TPA: NAD(+) kinase [Pseudomonadales bacterium]|nr:NAD(+) kinase [Pseudomonadales bacterium]